MKEKIREIFSIRNDIADYDEIKERIVGASNVTGTNLCILMLAILIASIGLNMNSTAVIIGAMLISPIWGLSKLWAMVWRLVTLIKPKELE